MGYARAIFVTGIAVWTSERMAEQAPTALLADKRYDADAICTNIARRGIQAVIQGLSNRRIKIEHCRVLYRERNDIKHVIGRLKINRPIASRGAIDFGQDAECVFAGIGRADGIDAAMLDLVTACRFADVGFGGGRNVQPHVADFIGLGLGFKPSPGSDRVTLSR